MDITYNIILPLLQFIAAQAHSYGWAIIWTTLLIRIAVWPLVSSQTKNMKRMAGLQPKLKELKERYGSDPVEFQKKTMEFYQKNKVNPLSGCLPMLVQLPILIGLYSTFMGPPFQDKAIPVKVTLAKPAEKEKVKVVGNPSSGSNSPYVSPQGKLAKFVVQPGDQTLVWGTSNGVVTNEPNVIDFRVNAVEGEAPADFKPVWHIQTDTNQATIDKFNGLAYFPKEGEITVEARFNDGTKLDVPVKVEGKAPEGGGWNPLGGGGPSGAEAFKTKTEQTAESTVDVGGKKVSVVVTPGPSTIAAGARNVQFHVKSLDNSVTEEQLKAQWFIVKDPNSATIDENGHAVFPMPGEVTVAAEIPGIAKNERFLFVESLGKVVKGADMFKPENWDVLSMLIAFAVTMWLSQKLMVTPSADPEDEQAQIQKQTQQTMPIMLTAMFFFFALPAGVYIYLTVSNVMQTLQTWIIYKGPTPELVDVTDGPSTPTASGSAIDKGGIIDVKATSTDENDENLDGKKKQKKKK